MKPRAGIIDLHRRDAEIREHEIGAGESLVGEDLGSPAKFSALR